jgi:hypothetical protein
VKQQEWYALFNSRNAWVGTAIQKTIGVFSLLVGRVAVGEIGSLDAARRIANRCRSETNNSIDTEPSVSDSPDGSNPKGKK